MGEAAILGKKLLGVLRLALLLEGRGGKCTHRKCFWSAFYDEELRARDGLVGLYGLLYWMGRGFFSLRRENRHESVG